MDEPTNGLDIPSKRQFRRMVAASIDQKSCIVISTHQVLDLDEMIDNIIILNDHEIIFNETSEVISKKLVFKASETNEFDETLLYSEETLNGFHLIKENKTGETNKIDIELLFNAIISDHHRIKDLFKS
jgi:ABC-2 type transport system ATP-binding protein